MSQLRSASSKLDVTPSPDAPSVQESVTKWVDHYGRYILGGIVLMGVLLVLASRVSTGQRLGAEHDYLAADLYFEQLFASNANHAEALQKLSKIISDRPELGAKYEGAIAHFLFRQGDNLGASPVAKRTLDRLIKLGDSDYRSFAWTTLQIGKGQYVPALEAAELLQGKLEAEGHVHSDLYAYNLLRIATLNQQLGNKEGERQAWTEIETLLGLSDTDREPFDVPIIRNFQQGTVDLAEYIEARKQALNS